MNNNFVRLKIIELLDTAVLSFHFRFYVFEQIIIEEVDDCDPQAVAQLLERGNGGAVVSAADHIVHGGLRDAADCAQLVNSQVSLCT